MTTKKQAAKPAVKEKKAVEPVVEAVVEKAEVERPEPTPSEQEAPKTPRQKSWW